MLNFNPGAGKYIPPSLLLLAPLDKNQKNTAKTKAIASTHSNREYVII